MECRIYKYDKDYRVNKEMEGIEFYIRLENKQQLVDFLIIFLDSNLEKIKKIDFDTQGIFEKLNPMETLLIKDKLLESIKKYINNEFNYKECNLKYGIKRMEQLKKIINNDQEENAMKDIKNVEIKITIDCDGKTIGEKSFINVDELNGDISLEKAIIKLSHRQIEDLIKVLRKEYNL